MEEWRRPPDRHDPQTGELSETHLQVNQREPGENHHDDVRDQERACAKEMNRFVSGFCAVQSEIDFAVELVIEYSRYINQLYSSSLVIFTARKRSLERGNVFTPVCHSVHGERHMMGVVSLSRGSRFRGVSIGGSKGGYRGRVPPEGPNSFILMQFLAKKLKNNSTFGSWGTPGENPGSATVICPGGLCPGVIFVQGSLSGGVSVQGDPPAL